MEKTNELSKCYQIENLDFTYPNRENSAISGINFSVCQGEFVTLCGKSGCGKTTLLRLFKSSLAPYGKSDGDIYFMGKPLNEASEREQAEKIGFVMQSCDNQIVTDKVWHELAFGLESLGCDTDEIRTRVAEMASFFGIQTWFHKKVTELSGGQKQLLNLASVMVMQPSVLILDEPTSQLDPIAAEEFLKTLEKINRELGITVILTEHRLEEAFSISDRVIVMEEGKIIADGTPKKVCEVLKNTDNDMYAALPTPVRVFGAIEETVDLPLTVCEGRYRLENFAREHTVSNDLIKDDEKAIKSGGETVIEVKDVWFRYEKNLPDVIKGLNMEIKNGELFAIVGGNGTGKTTALSLLSGLNLPCRGKISIEGKIISQIPDLYDVLTVLPQNPQALFVKKTVYQDLLEMVDAKLSIEEKEEKIKKIAFLCRIESLLESHPYDLSGGEQQRAALAKVLLLEPRILLMDEPTKGMDAHFKEIFADILQDLKASGVTVVMVSHDIEFCAAYADRCAMFFDGGITSCNTPRKFFTGNRFYTTAANRMARSTASKALLAEDIIAACGKEIKKREHISRFKPEIKTKREEVIPCENNKKGFDLRKILGGLFIFSFIVTVILTGQRCGWNFEAFNKKDLSEWQLAMIFEIICTVICFFPKREVGIEFVQQPQSRRKLGKRTVAATILILLAIPLTVYFGVFYLQNRKYYFISLLIILETMIPFAMVFESRKPQAREVIIISVLCAIAVAGRMAFFMTPQFKPVVALVIISGVCFGGETGFLVGAVTAFVSNFFFGQGPWTPWQMFAFGIIGFVSGIFFRKGFLRKTRASLAIFGGTVTFFLYGGIMNPASVVAYQVNPTAEMLISSYVMGAPFDFIHAVSTAFFLWFAAEPMIDKLERVKVKYGLIER